MKLKVDLIPLRQRKQKPTDPLKLEFGTTFTDHMFTMSYREGMWNDPRIGPFQPLSLNPAAMCLHYGQGVFEGMKAYRRKGKVYLFRPRDNILRLNSSAKRIVMPEVDIDFTLDCLKDLIRIERDWIPEVSGTSLYIRPTMIATEPKLGVRASLEYLFYIILSPVGPYFREGFNPVKLLVSEKYVRAVRGGIGFSKTVGNYAASLLAGKEAADQGYSQVLWLDALDRQYIEETSTMNVFVKFRDELATSPLDGTILPGITRDSVLRISRDWGLKVSERRVSIHELLKGIEAGTVQEVFGAGTAAIIAPIGELSYQGTAYVINGGKTGDLTRRLYDEILGIQCGERQDSHGWVLSV
ncbi:MAG: branched chain amino acid aminotransferase [Candidatus Thorarchaeota archaeon]|nr:MAG: branched chain amino acid aminotransferase [Candidatus Thorarchaeota archaeon]